MSEKKKRKAVAPKDESKRERFVRLAQARMTGALKKLDQVQKLANKSQYEYTDADVQKILAALAEKFEEIKSAYKTGVKTEEGFTL